MDPQNGSQGQQMAPKESWVTLPKQKKEPRNHGDPRLLLARKRIRHCGQEAMQNAQQLCRKTSMWGTILSQMLRPWATVGPSWPNLRTPRMQAHILRPQFPDSDPKRGPQWRLQNHPWAPKVTIGGSSSESYSGPPLAPHFANPK